MTDRGVDVSFRTDLSIDEIGVVWRQLEATALSSFFLSWSWVGSWLRQTGLPASLLLCHRHGALIGLALIYSAKSGSYPKLTVLHLNSSGRGDLDSIFVEYNGLLASRDDLASVSEAFRACLMQRRWAQLHLPGISAPLMSIWRDRVAVVSEMVRSAPYVDLAALRIQHRPYLASLSGNCRQQINRSLRLYRQRGTTTLEVAATLAEAFETLDDIKRLHQRWWQRRGKRGAFAVTFFEVFHRALLQEAWPEGQIDLLRLRVDGRVVGCLYNFIYAGRAYAYQSGFGEDADPRCKPGLVMHALAAERYSRLGFERYLLLAGASRYKTSLANAAEDLHWLVVRRTGWRAAALDMMARTVGVSA